MIFCNIKCVSERGRLGGGLTLRSDVWWKGTKQAKSLNMLFLSVLRKVLTQELSCGVFTASAVWTTQWVNKHTILILIPMKTTCGSVTFFWLYLEKPSQIKLLHHFMHLLPFNQLMLATSFPVKLKPHIKDKMNLVLSRKQTQMHLLLYWRPTHLHTAR